MARTRKARVVPSVAPVPKGGAVDIFVPDSTFAHAKEHFEDDLAWTIGVFNHVLTDPDCIIPSKWSRTEYLYARADGNAHAVVFVTTTNEQETFDLITASGSVVAPIGALLAKSAYSMETLPKKRRVYTRR